MKIAPEGKPFVALAVIAALFLALKNRFAGLIGAAASLFIVAFFRDPERDVVVDERKITSPADGTVVSIEEVDETDFVKGPAVKIAIFMSIFDVHINRAPAAGTADLVRHVSGKFLPAWDKNASFENERNLLGITTPRGRLLVKQVAGVVARRIVCRVAEGDVLRQGGKIGMIKFSSRAEVFIAKDDRLRVNVNIMDKVQAGLTVLAEYAE